MFQKQENILDINLIERDLNEQQREAVFSSGNSQLVLSGAGSGKTRVLTYKIIYLLKIKNIPPENILALTFTNKAAGEMKQRIGNLIGDKYSRKLVMGTFHSIFCKILRKNINHLKGGKYHHDFKIITESEVKSIIKSIIETEFNQDFEHILIRKNINDNVKRDLELKNLVRKTMERISFIKNSGITPEDYQKLEDETRKDADGGMEFLKSLYKIYVKNCQDENVMDFDDLLLNTFILFNDLKNVSILEKYQDKFKYILVDEYQDTNIVQFEIIKAIAWKSKNIFVVGDDCQSIYAFRGADIKNISRFKLNFPHYKESQLCQNYRSNKIIVEVSNNLIRNNKKQIKKNIISEIEPKEGKMKLLECDDGLDEANKIAFVINELVQSNKCEYKDIALLYRMNMQYYPFKVMFFQKNIPHKISSGIGIFDSKIIKIIYYYLKFIDDPYVDFCLDKIINFPKRNIGKVSLNKLFAISKLKKIKCWDIISSCDDIEKSKEYDINGDLCQKLIPFKSLILHLKLFSLKNRVYSTVLELLKCLDIKNNIKDESSLDIIKLFLDKVSQMEEEHIYMNIEMFTLSDFLEEFSLLMGNEENDINEKSKNENKVKLMTVHQAKGLEFKYVFIVGLEEGYFPCGPYKLDDDELEEERRIFYVAITRAKINCYLSFAKKRFQEKRDKSRFLYEINDSKLIQNYEPENYFKEKNKIYANFNKKEKKEKKQKISIINISSSKPLDYNNFSKIDNEINYINFEPNSLLQNNNIFINNSFKYENININAPNYIKLDENEENIKNEINKKKKKKEKLNNESEKDIKEKIKKEKIPKEKSDKKLLNKKTLQFKTIDSFFAPKDI